MASRRRVDLLLVERGLCATRAEAQRLLLAGKVCTAGQRVDKPGTLLAIEAALLVGAPIHPFVSRGGVKLQHALFAFGVDPHDRVCLDVGASTGGFTDCLLQAGARVVIAVDVGYGQLHERLRQDARVHVLERTNIRHLDASRLPAVPDLATIDVSFISLALVLPPVRRLLAEPFDIVALVKPQFEVGKGAGGEAGRRARSGPPSGRPGACHGVCDRPGLRRGWGDGLATARSHGKPRVLGPPEARKRLRTCRG